MVEFESKIYKSIPIWAFKSKMLIYEKDAKYKVIIEKIEESKDST